MFSLGLLVHASAVSEAEFSGLRDSRLAIFEYNGSEYGLILRHIHDIYNGLRKFRISTFERNQVG